MKELKRGDTLQVTIEAATVDGTGVARVDGQVVFVPGALPGELCRIRIAHIGRSAVFAELLRVEHLKQYFPVKTGFGKTVPLKAVDDVSFSINEGETLGLVGESGCGKTTNL